MGRGVTKTTLLLVGEGSMMSTAPSAPAPGLRAATTKANQDRVRVWFLRPHSCSWRTLSFTPFSAGFQQLCR